MITETSYMCPVFLTTAIMSSVWDIWCSVCFKNIISYEKSRVYPGYRLIQHWRLLASCWTLEGGLNIVWKVMSVTAEFSTVTKNMTHNNSKVGEQKSGTKLQRDLLVS